MILNSLKLNKPNRQTKFFRQKAAFTLIELLVVIAIIGILSGLIVVGMNNATNSANDAKRKASVASLAKAVIASQTLGTTLPTSTTWCDLKQDGSGCPGFPDAVASYIGSIPTDPLGASYKYYSDGATFNIRGILSDSTYYKYSSLNSNYSPGNIFTLNQSNGCESGTTSTNYSFGSTISAEPTGTTSSWRGNYSLKIALNNAATGEGAYGMNVSIKPNTTYTLSVYMKGDVGKSIVVGTEERNISGTIVTSHSTSATLSSSWTRTILSFTTISTIASIDYYIRSATQQACTFYIDGLQIEESSNATAWMPGN